MMQYVPRDILHQLLEHDTAGEFRWKDILDQVRIALSDLSPTLPSSYDVRLPYSVFGILLIAVVVAI